jgi:hypothetical protein
MHDTQGARRLLAGLTCFVPRLKKIWADAAYRGKELADWCQAQGDWDLEVVERTPGVRGFSVLEGVSPENSRGARGSTRDSSMLPPTRWVGRLGKTTWMIRYEAGVSCTSKPRASNRRT